MRSQKTPMSVFCLALTVLISGSICLGIDYPIVDTGQSRCFDNRREISCPKSGQTFFGQDAQYRGNQPAYRDNGDVISIYNMVRPVRGGVGIE